MLELGLRAAGVILVGLALGHAWFPRRFRWKEGLAGLALLDRQLMHVHTLFIAVTVGFFGVLSFLLAGAVEDGDRGGLAFALLAGFAAFWGLRLAVQLLVFDRRLWRGHRGRTAIHLLLALLWSCLTALYAAAAWTARP